MTTRHETRIDRLAVHNFRLFKSLKIDFHPRLTVLTAPNGGGKTSALDAVAVAWRLLVDALQTAPGSAGFARADIRRVLGASGNMQKVPPVSVTAQGIVLGARIPPWTRVRASDLPHARTTYARALHLREVGVQLRSDIQTSAEQKTDGPVLPIIAYYGTGRLWDQSRLTKGRKTKPDTSRISGYTDCLNPSSSFRFFADWFARMSDDAEREIKSGRASLHQPRVRVAAVRKAVEIALAPSGWLQLEMDPNEEVLAASHADFGRLPVEWLSDGIRVTIGLVGDLAHRCVRLNPHLGVHAAAKTPGIVMIDEVDMHLHPEWQQLVIGSLRKAFPEVQFIVTTHSPQVLTTVGAESVRILSVDEEGVGSAVWPKVSTLGREAADALAYVFDTDSKPMGLQLPSGIGVVDAVHRVEQYIRAGKEQEQTAQDLLGELKAFGVQIPEVDLKLWRFMAGRQKEG